MRDTWKKKRRECTRLFSTAIYGKGRTCWHAATCPCTYLQQALRPQPIELRRKEAAARLEPLEIGGHG